jgi:hypothetical protein
VIFAERIFVSSSCKSQSSSKSMVSRSSFPIALSSSAAKAAPRSSDMWSTRLSNTAS